MIIDEQIRQKHKFTQEEYEDYLDIVGKLTEEFAVVAGKKVEYKCKNEREICEKVAQRIIFRRKNASRTD